MNIKSYLQGDDIALLINAIGNDINLADFDITVVLYMKGYESSRFCASTIGAEHSAPVLSRSATQIAVNIPGSATINLLPGTYLSQTTYTHKATNVSKSFVNEAFVLTKKNHCSHE